ncbi:MAG: alpha/beta fold hydrolase [Alphaproteobacteria bacterium]|jgi:putative redox protein|nr:alpha/beta fold hydrolase [Alphaproteobacteria bacterium]
MSKASRIDFTGAHGQTLAARLDMPEHEHRAVALFAHCFSCSKDIHAAQRIARRLAERGIAVLRFDFTGLGHSEGDFANTNFSTNIQDLVAAAQWLGDNLGGPDILVGHSLGGAASVMAADQIDSVRAVATIGAPSDADHVIQAFHVHLDEIEETGQAEVSLAGRPFTIKKQFVEDVRDARVREAAGHMRAALLVLHSPTDQTVGIENATGLFVAARHPKSFIGLDGADHLMTREQDAHFAADMIATWSARYAFTDGEEQPAHESAPSRGVVVAETGGGRFENEVVIGRHHFLADEPESVGGGGRGPDPYELVTAGLGACTSMTLRMYAERKKWPLERVSVSLSHAKDHAEDCEECETDRKIDIFEREIAITGDLTGEQRRKLLEIADKCPVHRTLEDQVHIRTRLTEGQENTS